MTRKRLLIVDTLNSAYYLKHTNDTNVMWRFISDMRDLAIQFKIDRVIFVYEGRGGSKYRKEIYPEYKCDRKARKEKATEHEKKSLAMFMNSYSEMIKRASTFGIKTVNVDGAEADDTIAYLINHIDLSKYQIMLLSSDTDLNQLLRPGVVQATYGKAMADGLSKGRVPASLFMNFEQYCQENGITPEEYAFAKSLSGDTSDSIKGFDGIGEKTALALIKKYKTFANIKANLDTLNVPRLQKKSVDHMKTEFDLVFRNYRLINLNWKKPTYESILGDSGVEKLTTFISEIPTPEFVDREQITELCYEYGRIDIVEQLDFWLHSFGGRC